MPVYALGPHTPEIDPESWIAPNAVVIGQVKLAKNASIWWNCTVRGDTDRLIIGETALSTHSPTRGSQPVGLGANHFMEPTVGFEPTTCSLRGNCSTPELSRRCRVHPAQGNTLP